MRIDWYQDSDVMHMMNKAAFLDPKFKTLAHIPADAIDDTSRSIGLSTVRENMQGM